jgi:hypothetical protein
MAGTVQKCIEKTALIAVISAGYWGRVLFHVVSSYHFKGVDTGIRTPCGGFGAPDDEAGCSAKSAVSAHCQTPSAAWIWTAQLSRVVAKGTTEAFVGNGFAKARSTSSL